MYFFEKNPIIFSLKRVRYTLFWSSLIVVILTFATTPRQKVVNKTLEKSAACILETVAVHYVYDVVVEKKWKPGKNVISELIRDTHNIMAGFRWVDNIICEMFIICNVMISKAVTMRNYRFRGLEFVDHASCWLVYLKCFVQSYWLLV